MSLYPTLEDMKVDQMLQAEESYKQAAVATAHAIVYPDAPQATPPPAYGAATPSAPSSLYPSLEEYMGLALTPDMLAQTTAVVPVATDASKQVAVPPQTQSGRNVVAPITGNSVGVQRAEIKQGVRPVVLCKDGEGKLGLRVKSINKGIFVAFVHKNSPSALAGLRFGDQILQINEENVAGWDTDKTMKILKKCSPERITMAIRDRPFERTITMQKDSTGHIGFVFKDGKITAIVKDSSAARNGILTDHHLVEVDGQNVVGLKDKDTGDIIAKASRSVTITLIPTFIYDHMVKSIGSSLLKKHMDHSIPDV